MPRAARRLSRYPAMRRLCGLQALVDPKAAAFMTLAFCWSHVRRGFYDLAKAKAPIATEALRESLPFIGSRQGIRGKTAAHRLAVRQAESTPLVRICALWFECSCDTAARGPTAEPSAMR